MNKLWLLLVTMMCLVLLLSPESIAQQAAVSQATVAPSGSVQVKYLSQPPDITPEMQRNLEEALKCLSNLPGPQTPVDANARPEQMLLPGSETKAAEAQPMAPGDFNIYRNNDLGGGAPSSQTSFVGEPSVGNNGDLVFQSGNWYASFSDDGGQNFSYVNPYTTFPNSYGGFCCDQDVIFDPSNQLMLWTMLYLPGAADNGAIRVAVANGATNLRNGAWYYYDLTPQQLGLPSGRWYDYPHVSIGATRMYISLNVFTTAGSWTNTVLLSLPLAGLASGGGFGYSYINVTDRFNFTQTQGAGTTIYWASHNSTSSLRIYRWAEGSGTYFWNDVAHTAYTTTNRGSAHCVGPDGRDWCGRFDDRVMAGYVAGGVVGFMWNVAEGGGFVYPYTRIVRVAEADMSLLSEPVVFNPSYAWIYPSVGVNARGHLGGSIFWGGGSNYPNANAWIADDYNAGALQPLTNYPVAGSTNGPTSNVWGDYVRSRPHSVKTNTWIATAFTMQGGGANSNARPRFVWFGRERDYPLVSVTVQTNPAGRSFTVDGTTYSSTQVFSWTSGSVHTIATSSPQSGAAGVRYVWSGWSDGGAISHSVAPVANATYTANFTTQYFLTMSAGTGGTVAPSSAWYNSGSLVTISATPSACYTFASWTGSGTGSYTGTNNPASITMNGPISELANFALTTVAITVTTNPVGRSFSVDGTPYSSPQTFTWNCGSSHTIATTTPQSAGAGIRYVWGNWSDGGAISHTVAPTTNTTYTANYARQNYLTMTAGAGGTASPASGWYYNAQVVTISATPDPGNTFTGWTGTGAGSYTGLNNPATVTMNDPITELASFGQPPVSVTVQTNPTGRSFTVDGTPYTTTQVFSWVNGSSHTIATTSPQSGAAGVQYVWTDWSDGGAISHAVAPTTNITYTANFTTQYYLTMSAGTGGSVTPPSGWYNSAQGVTITATPDPGYTFTAWAGSGSGSYTGTNNPASVTMNGPITELASFTGGLPSISPITQSPSYTIGDSFWVYVKVGDPNVVTDLFGISFKLTGSDQGLCKYVPGTADSGSFLGSSIIKFTSQVNDSTVDIAVTKTSGSGVNGTGYVAKAKFYTIAPSASPFDVVFCLSDVSANNSVGDPIALQASCYTVHIVNGLCVWPGDCDNLGSVTSADVLKIGLYYGQTKGGGTCPNNSGTSWRCYVREPWTADAGTPRRVYADANGDCTINSADVLAIGLNYARTHSLIMPSASRPTVGQVTADDGALSIQVPGRSIVPGEAFDMGIKLESAQPVYGVSFKLRYKLNGREYGTRAGEDFLLKTLSVDRTEGVLGEVVAFSSIQNEEGFVDIGMTKTQGNGFVGNGELVKIKIQPSSLATEYDAISFEITDIIANDESGNPVVLKSDAWSGIVASVEDKKESPKAYQLYQNYPNPFNPSTTISYFLPNDAFVTLQVFDVLGREIITLVDRQVASGTHNIMWDGKSATGVAVNSGVFLAKLTISASPDKQNIIATRRMVLMK